MHCRSDGYAEVKLPLRAGWNRLLLVQNPGRHAMGMVMMIPSDDGREFWFGRAPEQSRHAEGWNTVGPLKLSLEEATPSLKFERLVQDNYVPELEYLTDPDAYLSQSRFRSGNPPRRRGGGETRLEPSAPDRRLRRSTGSTWSATASCG